MAACVSTTHTDENTTYSLQLARDQIDFVAVQDSELLTKTALGARLCPVCVTQQQQGY